MVTEKVFYTDSNGRDFLKRVTLILPFDKQNRIENRQLKACNSFHSSFYFLFGKLIVLDQNIPYRSKGAYPRIQNKKTKQNKTKEARASKTKQQKKQLTKTKSTHIERHHQIHTTLETEN